MMFHGVVLMFYIYCTMVTLVIFNGCFVVVFVFSSSSFMVSLFSHSAHQIYPFSGLLSRCYGHLWCIFWFEGLCFFFFTCLKSLAFHFYLLLSVACVELTNKAMIRKQEGSKVLSNAFAKSVFFFFFLTLQSANKEHKSVCQCQ